MVEDQHAAVRQFLQRAYGVAAQFRRRPRDFERFQVHSFWKQTGQKPKDPSTSKWVLLFLMRAATTHMRHRAGKYAVILDGLQQDQVETGAVAARIQELGGVGAAYEAMRARKREDAQVSGTVAVADRAAAGRRTRRDDECSSLKSGESANPTKHTRRRRPQPTFPRYPLIQDPFSDKKEEKIEPRDTLVGECLAEEEFEEGVWICERVPREPAFDFVQRITREYAKIKDEDHKSVRRVLQRAYLAALRMQREPDQFERFKADPFWNASLHKPKDPWTSKWILFFVMRARTPNVRNLAGNYAATLDGLMRDKVKPDDLPIARMEGLEAAYEAWQARKRLRGLESWFR
jgi:hypothetical protein